METKSRNKLLLIGFIVPLVLLFWPFAQWGNTMNLLLRVVPAISMQVMLYQAGKHNILKVFPLILTGLFALWGIYLYFTSPHWSYAAFWGSLVAGYISPLIACAIVYCILALRHKV